MPQGLKRYYGKQDLHYITCSCYRRLPLLGSKRARNLFVKILGEVRDAYGFALVGFVVMPEHIHLLIGEPRKETPGTPERRTQAGVPVLLEAGVGAACVAGDEDQGQREKSKTPPASTADGAPLALPQFWQRRFCDFNVWSHKKKMEKLEYMHRNPVKRGLIAASRDWVWSSCAGCEGCDDGLVRIDPL
jgi:putative transposase